MGNAGYIIWHTMGKAGYMVILVFEYEVPHAIIRR